MENEKLIKAMLQVINSEINRIMEEVKQTVYEKDSLLDRVLSDKELYKKLKTIFNKKYKYELVTANNLKNLIKKANEKTSKTGVLKEARILQILQIDKTDGSEYYAIIEEVEVE